MKKYFHEMRGLMFEWHMGDDLRDIWTGILGLGRLVGFLLIRIILILLLPLSAAVAVYARKKTEEHEKKQREDMRLDLHRNGRG